MKRVVFIVSSLMIGISSFSQIGPDMIKLGTVKQLPMRKAKVFKYKHSDKALADYVLMISIISDTDSIFSVRDGKVVVVLELPENNFSVTISDNDSIYYSYLRLNKVVLKKDDTIAKGDLIGLAEKVYEKFDLHFMVYSNGRELMEDKIWQLIKDE
jgi:hypothetical protein